MAFSVFGRENSNEMTGFLPFSSNRSVTFISAPFFVLDGFFWGIDTLPRTHTSQSSESCTPRPTAELVAAFGIRVDTRIRVKNIVLPNPGGPTDPGEGAWNLANTHISSTNPSSTSGMRRQTTEQKRPLPPSVDGLKREVVSTGSPSVGWKMVGN